MLVTDLWLTWGKADMALDNFYKGISDGMNIGKDAYDASIKTAKDELVLQGLYDTYGDNQALRPDMMRNQFAQLDLDTARRGASLDGLYRTHDLGVESKRSRSAYDITNYNNLIEDIQLWGQARRDAEKQRLDTAKLRFGNEEFVEQLKGDINDATRPTQYATGLNLVEKDNLVSQDQVFDAQTQLDINPDQWYTTVDGAKKLRVDARTGRVIAEEAQPYVISKGVTDAIYGDQKANYTLDEHMATKEYNLNTATQAAFLKARDAETQVAVRDVSLTVSGVPLDQQEALLEQIATTDKDPYKQIAAQSLLNEMKTQRETQQQIADAGYVVLPDGKVKSVGGTTTAGGTSSNLTPQEKADLAVREDAMKRINSLISSLTNDDDGFTESDRKLIEQARIDMGLTGTGGTGGTGAGTPTIKFSSKQQSDYLEYGIRNLGWQYSQQNGNFYKRDGTPVDNSDLLLIQKEVDKTKATALAKKAGEYATQKYGWKKDNGVWKTKDGKKVTKDMYLAVMQEYKKK